MGLAFRLLSFEFGLLDFGFWILGFGFSGRCEPLKWREGTHQSAKLVDFAMPANSGGHFQGLLDFLDVRLLGTALDLGFLVLGFGF